MAEIIWTYQAEKDLQEILNYRIKTESKEYAQEVFDEIKKRINIVSKDIYIGQRTDDKSIRIIHKYNYSIFYKVIDKVVYILLLTNNSETNKAK